jgi:hypothetical protein
MVRLLIEHLLTGRLCSSYPGLFTRRWRRHGESPFHWDVVPGLWFRLFTQDVKLTNLQNLSPRQENCFKEQTRRLSS